MKVCFVGTGSIGKRHIRNFNDICQQKKISLKIDVYRETRAPLTKEIQLLINNEFYNIEDLEEEYDIIFITNPTNQHYKTLQLLAHKAKAFFIEKPLFENKTRNLGDIETRKDGIYYVACPLRHAFIMTETKKLLEKIKIYSVRAMCSSYLPDWRKGIDYRNVYSASKEQGGGVCIDIIHEWDYLVDLFGIPNNVKMMCGKFSHLEIDSEDLAIYIAEYKDKLVELHLDYFGRRSRRELELYTKEGLWIVDLMKNEIRFENEVIRSFDKDVNTMYIRELEYFLDLCQGKQPNINDMQHALQVMHIAQK